MREERNHQEKFVIYNRSYFPACIFKGHRLKTEATIDQTHAVCPQVRRGNVRKNFFENRKKFLMKMNTKKPRTKITINYFLPRKFRNSEGSFLRKKTKRNAHTLPICMRAGNQNKKRELLMFSWQLLRALRDARLCAPLFSNAKCRVPRLWPRRIRLCEARPTRRQRFPLLLQLPLPWLRCEWSSDASDLFHCA